MSGLLRYYEVSDLERLSREECFALGENLARVDAALGIDGEHYLIITQHARENVVRMCRKEGREFAISESSPGMLQLKIEAEEPHAHDPN